MKQSVQQTLSKQAHQIATAAELAAMAINDWQTIQNYLTNRVQNITLTPLQQEKLQRYKFIYNQLMNVKYTEQDVIELVQSAFSISYSQVILDMRDTRELFSTVLSVNKLFEVKALLEMNKIMRQKAKEMNNMKAYAALEKNAQKLLSMLPEDESSMADQFLPRQNVIQFNPELVGVTPPTDQELRELLRDIRKEYGGSVSIAGRDIQDAEIIEDGTEEPTL